MAGLFFTIIALFTFGAPWSAAAATVAKKQMIIRREQKQQKVSVMLDGEAQATAANGIHAKHSTETAMKNSVMLDGKAQATASNGIHAQDSTETARIDYCNHDFPLGTDQTNLCSDSSGLSESESLQTSRTEIDEAECLQASVQAGAHKGVQGTDFDLTPEWYNSHPKGCFYQSCSAPGGACYFYNNAPATPNAITSGQPVCWRARLLFGTQYPNATATHCPTGYQDITDPATCRALAGCQGSRGVGIGKTVGDEFLMNAHNASKYNDYPKYCFLNAADDKVYFNAPLPGYTADPSNPVGTPICNVTSITTWG